MCNVDLGKYHDRNELAYEASVLIEGIRPKSESEIKSLDQTMSPYHRSTTSYYIIWDIVIWQNHGFLT